MGGLVALLIMTLPMKAALASSVVGAFVLLALVDTRVALLALILVRSTLDVTTTIPLDLGRRQLERECQRADESARRRAGLAHIGLNRVNVRRSRSRRRSPRPS